MIPLGRVGEADDIAKAVLYLASMHSWYLQGTEIAVDGGRLALPGALPFLEVNDSQKVVDSRVSET